MCQIKMAAPLYILRNEAEQDLFQVLEQIKALGFDGVELLGFFGKEPKAIREKLDAIGLQAIGNHVPADEFIKDPQKVISEHKMVGCSYITIAWPDRAISPAHPDFEKLLADIRYLSKQCLEAGITPLYHNHEFEFLHSPSSLDLIMESCKEDGLCLEPDLGWMAFKGEDPAEYLIRYADCSPVIHWKDIYAKDLSQVGEGPELGTQKANPQKGYFEFRPVGYGMLNVPKLFPLALACKPQWFVMDHDLAYDRDSYEDLKLSLDYIRTILRIAPEAN